MIESDKVWMEKRIKLENVKSLKMDLVKVSIFLLAIWLKTSEAKEVCPKMCLCDVFEGYKRADCSDQNLATPYTNIANSVEILNLSGNEITLIDDVCLSGYKDLVKLSFARNSIHTIELFAFESLEKLNYLDLSDNRLEVIDNRILERNEKLSFLDLSKNKFMLIDDSPLIISPSLEFLSLRNSHLSHVYNSIFKELPNLIDLDISNNLLITLIPASFESLVSLQFINLEYNRFTCDFRIENTLQMFKQRKVHVKIDKCVKNSKKPMFEKMILHPDATTESPAREDVEIDLLWGSSSGYKNSEFESENETDSMPQTIKAYYEKIKAESEGDNDEFNCDDDELFPSTCECHQKFIKYYETAERSKPLQKKSMEMRIATVFYLGIFLGFIAGCIVFFVLSLIRKKCENANIKQVERQKERNRMMTNVRLTYDSPRNSPMPAIRNRITVPVQPEEGIQSRSPIPTPRNVQNRVSQPPDIRRQTEPPARPRTFQSEVRSELSPTAQLIHKLFRNRDPKLLPDISEVRPLAPSTSRGTRRIIPTVHVHDEIYSEIPTAPNPTEPDCDGDDSSDYLSINNSSLTINLDNVRTGTPPPAYSKIFDED